MKSQLSQLALTAVWCAGLMATLAATPVEAQPAMPPPVGGPTRPLPPQAQYDPSTGLPLPNSTNVPPGLALDVRTGLPDAKQAREAYEKSNSGQIELYTREIGSLTSQGRYEESLQHCLACATQPLGLNFAQPLYRNWAELGRRYPPAMPALREVRDRETQQLSRPAGGSRELFAEVTCINHELHEEDATCALFHEVWQQNHAFGCYCYSTAEDALLEHGEYQYCLNFIGDPQARLEADWQGLEQTGLFQQRQDDYARNYDPPLVTPDQLAPATNGFVADACKLVEILMATGDQAGAEKIRGRAIELVGTDPRIESAVATAAENISKHTVVYAPPAVSGQDADDYLKPTGQVCLISTPDMIPQLWATMQPAAWMIQGQYDRSLQGILRIQAAHDPALLGLVMPDWEELGRLYPPARQSMASIRDRGARELSQGQGDVNLFREVQMLDEHLGENAAVVALFHQIEQQNPSLAHGYFYLVEPLLKQHGDYQTTTKYIGTSEADLANYIAHLEKIRAALPRRREAQREGREIAEKGLEKLAQSSERAADAEREFELKLQDQDQQFRQSMWDKMRTNPIYEDAEETPATPPASYLPDPVKVQPRYLPHPHLPPEFDSGQAETNAFVGHVRDMVEILVANGNRAEAEKIRAEAVAVLDDPRLRSAVTDAMQNTGQTLIPPR